MKSLARLGESEPRTSTPSTWGSVLTSMRGPATAIIRNPGRRRRTAGNAPIKRPSSSDPTPDPPTEAMQMVSPSRKPNRRRSSSRPTLAVASSPRMYPSVNW